MSEIPSQKPVFRAGIPVMVILAIVCIGLTGSNVHLSKQNKALLSKSQKSDELLSRLSKTRQQRRTLLKAFSQTSGKKTQLQKELDEIKSALSAADEEKTYLEDILIHKTKEIESLSRQSESEQTSAAAPARPAAASQDIDQRLKEKNAELEKLTEQNRILTRKLERLYKAVNDKISEINVAKITLEDTVSKARQTIQNEWSSVDLGEISTGQRSTKKETSSARPAKKEGKVLAVNADHGFVVVDLGKVDGIKTDTVFTLSQGGEKIATLNVLEVRELMTACNIGQQSNGRRIQINDSVRVGK